MGKYNNSIIMFLIVDIIGVIQGVYEYGVTEPAPHSPEVLFHKLFEQNIAALRQANPAMQGGPTQAQQYAGIPQGLDEFLKLQKQGKDTYFEPYWYEGEWVFQREPFTARPPNYMTLYSTVKPNLVKECAESCPRIYAGYGPVCGHYTSMNNGHLKMKQFYSLCHMLFENCIMTRTRHGNGEAAWRPALQGSCHLRWKVQPINEVISIRHTKQHLAELLARQETTTLPDLPKIKE